MLVDTSKYILTIVQALVDAGLEASDNNRNWWIGSEMAAWFRGVTGDLFLDYGPKTNGSGRHFLAKYPDTPEIRAKIVSLAYKYNVEAARQGDLFSGWKPEPDAPRA